MRRLSLLLVAASCLAVPAAYAMPIVWGAHAGASIPNLRSTGGDTELSKDYTSRLAPFFGGFAETPMSRDFTMRLELNFVGQGGKRSGMQPIQDTSEFENQGLVAPGTPLYGNFKTEAKLNYLEFPLLLGYHFGTARQFELQFGPYGGILLSAKTVTSGTSPIYTDSKGQDVLVFPPGYPGAGTPVPPVDFGATTDNKSSIKTFNWGLQGGFSIAQSVPGGAALLELRGGLGLTDIQKSSADGHNATGALVVALGYIWRPETD